MQLLFLEDVAHQAQLEGFLGWDEIAGEDVPHGVGFADEPGQSLCATDARDEP